jgi:hypothetical protein
MRRIFKQWLPILVATGSGLVVLIGYLLPPFASLRNALVGYAVVVAALALILGAANLLRVHLGRLSRWRSGGFYSLFLLLAAVGVGALVTLGEGPTQMLFEYALIPLGSSLAALVVFALTLALFQLMRVRRWEGVLFLIVVALVLLGSLPIFGLEVLTLGRNWLVDVLATAGTRGLLLGVALGTIITGLRVLLAIDRPHSDF